MRERFGLALAALLNPQSPWHIGTVWRQVVLWSVGVFSAQIVLCVFWGVAFLPGFTCTSAICYDPAPGEGRVACEFGERHYIRDDGRFDLNSDGSHLRYNPQYHWRRYGIKLFRPGIRINYYSRR